MSGAIVSSDEMMCPVCGEPTLRLENGRRCLDCEAKYRKCLFYQLNELAQRWEEFKKVFLDELIGLFGKKRGK